MLVETDRESRRWAAKVTERGEGGRCERALDERDVDEGLRKDGGTGKGGRRRDDDDDSEDFEGERFHTDSGWRLYDSSETGVAQEVGGVSHGFSGDGERVSRLEL